MPFIGSRLSSEVAAASASPDVSSIIQELGSNQLSKTARRFSKTTGVPFRGTSRSQAYRKEVAIGECPQGQKYYVCDSFGFRGCCSKNACDPNVVCPEGDGSAVTSSKDKSSHSSQTTPNSLSDQTTNLLTSSGNATIATTESHSQSQSETRQVKSVVTTASGKPAEASLSATAIRATEDVASAPSCPRGNGTTYSDNNNIAYVVRCNSDNSDPSYDNVQVSIGGYAQCFSTCSISGDCAGFTYVGLDGGTCYLKAKMSNDTYVAKSGNNYVSCAKIDPNASAPRPSASATPAPSSNQPNKGAIAGGVVGGIAVFGLMIFLIAFLARRRRKDIESKRATLTHVFGGAIEPGRRGDDDPQSLPLHHHHAGDTGTSTFAPFGDHGSIARDYAIHSNTTSPASNKGGSISVMALPKPPYPDAPKTPYYPAHDTKSPPETPYFLPATTYQPPSRSSPEQIQMLDSTPIPHNKPRSPRFHEHISELAGTSSPVPIPTPNANATQWNGGSHFNRDPGIPRTEAILPDHNVRLEEAPRRQQQLHLMSWNNYDDSRAAELQGGGVGATIGRGQIQQGSNTEDRKQGEKVSPDDSDSPLDRKFIVSPMGTLDRNRG
ncbi:hypothetical protein MBLNU13_g10678t1 [Cladosporium sp. NU13]